MNMDTLNIIEYYKDYLLKEKLVSENTMDAYTKDILALAEYIEQEKLSLLEVNVEVLRGYRRYMLHKIELDNGKIGYSESTTSRKIAAMKDFYGFLVEDGIIEINPASNLKSPKIPQRQRHYLTKEQAKSMIQETLKQPEPLRSRDRLMLTMFLTLGLRLEEMTDVKITSIVGDFIFITGKGNKERRVYLNSDVKDALKEYSKVRDIKQDHLFLTRSNKPLSRAGIRYTVNKYLKLADLDVSKLSTHSLRHSAATLMHKNGVDIKTLQEVLGHSRIETTMIYTHVDEDQLQSAAKTMEGMFN